MAKQVKQTQTAKSTKKSVIKKPKKIAVSKQPINHLIGKAIAKYRKNASLSQEQLAEQLGLGNEAISRIERGLVVPTVERLIKMAEIFDCPVSELLTETSNRPTDEAIYLQSLLSSVNEEDKQMLINMLEKLIIRLKCNDFR
ncbi:helix-turn-helix domain-containing protein [Entomomonas sp. E2T0]|uniref:helix-turn-helix domain-containing protein n=1 Tax=Entomomonas sp. E2T0 TaxID=2930213 RepID=UPI0022283E35|nr:helix-turn-helix transcriptional regulator [Entomomonas sp. E2T0]UYZ84872.1 helix-turn-helix domain-containing protein [Entomomonas sp. E2T0]